MSKKLSFFIVLTFLLLFYGCSETGSGGENVCDNVSCSGRGECVIDKENKAVCMCNDGYHAENLKCVVNTLECGVTEHEEAGICVSNRKMVDCIDVTPENGIKVDFQVEITWENGTWSNASNCDFTCEAGYNKVGGSCVEDNQNDVSNLRLENITDHSCDVLWDGNPNAKTWVYVHNTDTTGPQHDANNNKYSYLSLGSGLEFTVYVQGNGSDLVLEKEFTTLNALVCEADSCTELHKTICSIENNQIVCSCDEGYHDETGTCVNNGGNSYLKSIDLPTCDSENSEVQFIQNNSDWNHINDVDKRIFCVFPGDYTDIGEIQITSSGTPDKPRYILLNNGNNKHPVQLSNEELAKYRLSLINSNYWIIDRPANWKDVNPFNRLLKLVNSSYNIFNRGVLMDTANGITFYNGSNNNTIQNFHMEKTQWSVDYAVSHKTNSGLPPYSERIFADIAAIGFVGENPNDEFIDNVIVNNEIINYVDAFQLVRLGSAYNNDITGINPPLNAKGTVIIDNIFYTTPILYTNGSGDFDINGDRAITENAMDFKFGSLDSENPILVKNNVMFGYRRVDNTYSNLSDNGNAFVLHYGAGNIIFENNYIFDCKNGFAAGGPRGNDPAMYNIIMKNNIFYDMKENIDHIYGTRGVNSFDGTDNITIENNLFGKTGVFSLHAYNSKNITIKNNKFIKTKAMYFAPDFEDLRSQNLIISNNIFYDTINTGIPEFVTSYDNIHNDNFDWTPYKNEFQIRIHTATPTIKYMRE